MAPSSAWVESGEPSSPLARTPSITEMAAPKFHPQTVPRAAMTKKQLKEASGLARGCGGWCVRWTVADPPRRRHWALCVSPPPLATH